MVEKNYWKLCFAAWACFMAYIFLRWDAPVDDEVGFAWIASNTSPISAYLNHPSFGYGQIYWAVMSVVGLPGGRIISLIALISTALLTISLAPKKAPTLALWLTMPVAWWTGKLVGPELWAMALCAAAIFAAHKERDGIAGLCCGIAIGLKLNNMPIAVFCFLLILLCRPSVISLARFSATSVVGALISYPLIVWAKPTEVGTEKADLITTMLTAITDRYEWDGVYSGGALMFSIAALPLAILILWGLWKSTRVAVAFLGASVFYLAMLTMSGTQYGWYVFPLIPAALYLFSTLARAGAIPASLSALIIVANAIFQYPQIIFMLSQKNEQLAFLGNPHAAGCLIHNLKRLPPDARVFNVVEPGYKFPIPETFSIIHSREASKADTVIVMQRFLKSQFMRNQIQGKTMIVSCGEAMIFSSLTALPE